MFTFCAIVFVCPPSVPDRTIVQDTYRRILMGSTIRKRKDYEEFLAKVSSNANAPQENQKPKNQKQNKTKQAMHTHTHTHIHTHAHTYTHTLYLAASARAQIGVAAV